MSCTHSSVACTLLVPRAQARLSAVVLKATHRAAQRARTARSPSGCVCRAAAVAVVPDRTLMLKISLAKTSGSLDLSWLGLEGVPDEIFELSDLEELTLAGNRITTLPAKVAQFKSLKRLQVAGNLIAALPPEITQLTKLEEVWFHGNLLEELPADFGSLVSLRKLSLAGNRLASLPGSIAQLTQLTELSLSGNLLEEAPACLGGLGKLATLALNGNRIVSVAHELGQCSQLQNLALQANSIRELPEEMTQLHALEELNMSDNELERVPEQWSGLQALRTVWMYGNRLRALPADIFALPQLECIWAESNPLASEQLRNLLASLRQNTGPLREVGLDPSQVEALEGCMDSEVASKIRLGEVTKRGPGYFKLRRCGDPHQGSDPAPLCKVLVVTFASAPGTPNWGGLLNRILAEASPEEKAFDILYVCDGGRSWYSAGDDRMLYWREQLQKVTERYQRVLMLGDSMGATAALLFSDLATSVQAFTPQVKLADASIRPGQSQEWLQRAEQRVLESMNASSAEIVCHCGTWEHDLEQAKLLPLDKCNLKVHYVDSHRLAITLNRENKLLPAIRTAILKEMGLYRAPRLANLL